jgi:ubiquinone/menaquinone biosynthesis C-methylase UbiE
MRIALRGDNFIERVALALGKAPIPAGYAFSAMAVARIIGISQRVGIFALLASNELRADEVADRLDLSPAPTRMALDVLVGEGILARHGHAYLLGAAGRPWLDPSSATYIGTYVAHTAEYWGWWADIENVLRGGKPISLHDGPASDPGWQTYIRGQYELARLSAASVARAIPVPTGSTSLLDLGGGHGWFAASVCKRHRGLRATVVDLPGSAIVGRQIAAERDFANIVEYVDGDIFTTDLGGPHDVVMCGSLLHHFDPDQIGTILTRARAALRTGGTIAVVDLFHSEKRPTSSAAIFELFFHLTSGQDTPTEQTLTTQLASSGFSKPRRRDLVVLPDLRLYTARAV